MKHSKTPLWKKSMLRHLNYYDIMSCLEEEESDDRAAMSQKGVAPQRAGVE
jgi:hypothetical protein